MHKEKIDVDHYWVLKGKQKSFFLQVKQISRNQRVDYKTKHSTMCVLLTMGPYTS